MVPCLVEAVNGTRLPLGTTTKNSEILEYGPIAHDGTHPPLGVLVAVRATKWKMIVAFPVLSTVTDSEFGARLAEDSWNLVIHQIAGCTPLPFPQLFL
jgi:hypothetical protein